MGKLLDFIKQAWKESREWDGRSAPTPHEAIPKETAQHSSKSSLEPNRNAAKKAHSSTITSTTTNGDEYNDMR